MVHMYVNSTCDPPMIHLFSIHILFKKKILPKLLPLVHTHTSQVHKLAYSNIWMDMFRLQVDAKKGLLIHCIVGMLDISNIAMVV